MAGFGVVKVFLYSLRMIPQRERGQSTVQCWREKNRQRGVILEGMRRDQ